MKPSKTNYKVGDTVKFKLCRNNHDQQTDIPIYDILEGEVYIVDERGTWDNPGVRSYDVMVHNDKHKVTRFDPITETRTTETVVGDCLYKHISENLIVE